MNYQINSYLAIAGGTKQDIHKNNILYNDVK